MRSARWFVLGLVLLALPARANTVLDTTLPLTDSELFAPGEIPDSQCLFKQIRFVVDVNPVNGAITSTQTGHVYCYSGSRKSHIDTTNIGTAQSITQDCFFASPAPVMVNVFNFNMDLTPAHLCGVGGPASHAGTLNCVGANGVQDTQWSGSYRIVGDGGITPGTPQPTNRQGLGMVDTLGKRWVYVKKIADDKGPTGRSGYCTLQNQYGLGVVGGFYYMQYVQNAAN